MAEGGQRFFSPQPPVPLFAVGDMVHVFEGTGVGKEGLRNVGWFGKVVGRGGCLSGAQSAFGCERTS